jgi:hypothetical protein
MEELFQFLDQHFGLSPPVAVIFLVVLWFLGWFFIPVLLGFAKL